MSSELRDIEQQALRTFSIANSSSALTLISRAFSKASCLMKATYENKKEATTDEIMSTQTSLRAAANGASVGVDTICGTNHLVHLADNFIIVKGARRHRSWFGGGYCGQW